MSPISKNDKQIWENYVANLNSYNINLVNNKKKYFSKSRLKVFQKDKINNPEGVIDLHGYRLHTAKIILHNYIVNAYENNIRNVLIITGKGYNNTGALKKEVPLWLNDEAYVGLLINFKTAPSKFGGTGALLVRIKNKYKSQLI